jgi:hypothetical protein
MLTTVNMLSQWQLMPRQAPRKSNQPGMAMRRRREPEALRIPEMATRLRRIRHLPSKQVVSSVLAASLALAALPSHCQSSRTGDAKSIADCSISNTGNNNVFIIDGCTALPDSVRRQIIETLTNQKRILNNQARDREETDKRFDELTQEYKELLQRFSQTESYFQDSRRQNALKARFPLGYVIFDVDHTNAVFPYPPHGLENFKFDWTKVRVMENSSTKLTLRMPDIYTDSGMTKILNTSLGWNGPPFDRTESFGVGLRNCLIVGASILTKREDGVVFVIGFAPEICPPVPGNDPRFPSGD